MFTKVKEGIADSLTYATDAADYASTAALKAVDVTTIVTKAKKDANKKAK